MLSGLGECAAFAVIFAAEHFRDAKIEQLHFAITSHENVTGFEIAVNHQIPVGKLHCIANFQKQRQPLVNR